MANPSALWLLDAGALSEDDQLVTAQRQRRRTTGPRTLPAVAVQPASSTTNPTTAPAYVWHSTARLIPQAQDQRWPGQARQHAEQPAEDQRRFRLLASRPSRSHAD